jgi:HK97 family phage major capsid protein
MEDIMSKYLDAARSKMDRLNAELGTILSANGDDESQWAPGIMERSNRLVRGIEKATLEFDALSERGDKIEAIRQAALDPRNRESGFGGRTVLAPSGHDATRAWDGWDGRGSIANLDSEDGLRSRALVAVETMDDLEPAARSQLDTMLRADRTAGEAKAFLALANPAYRSAFDSWIQDPISAPMRLTAEESAAWRDVQVFRTAMGTGAGVGGALMPLTLDPSIVIANGGAVSSIRQYAKLRTTLTNQYRAVTSPGSTAEWKVEGAEAADASPAINVADIPVYFSDQSLTVSYELFQDTDVSQQLGTLIADAFAVQENNDFVSGSGSTAPYGALTRVTATTGSRVSPQTASSFSTNSVSDIFKVRDALPVRYRISGSAAWVSNIAIQSIIQQIGVVGVGSNVAGVGPNGFWANMQQGSPPNLLGLPCLEASAMTGTIGASANVLLLVDWSRYVIADRIGTTIVVGNKIGSNGRSIASHEVFAYRRLGADLIDTNAGRVLKL